MTSAPLGGATQGNISIPVCDVCGGYLEGYKADEGRPVWGFDVGLEVGIGPTILGAACTKAEATNQGVKAFVDLLLQTAKQAEQAVTQDPWSLRPGPINSPINNVMPTHDGVTTKVH